MEVMKRVVECDLVLPKISQLLDAFFENVQAENIVFQGTSQDIVIANNVFLSNNDNPGWADQCCGVIESSYVVSLYIIGNLMVNLRGLNSGIQLFDGGSDVQVYNNVWANNVVGIINFILPGLHYHFLWINFIRWIQRL